MDSLGRLLPAPPGRQYSFIPSLLTIRPTQLKRHHPMIIMSGLNSPTTSSSTSPLIPGTNAASSASLFGNTISIPNNSLVVVNAATTSSVVISSNSQVASAKRRARRKTSAVGAPVKEKRAAASPSASRPNKIIISDPQLKVPGSIFHSYRPTWESASLYNADGEPGTELSHPNQARLDAIIESFLETEVSHTRSRNRHYERPKNELALIMDYASQSFSKLDATQEVELCAKMQQFLKWQAKKPSAHPSSLGVLNAVQLVAWKQAVGFQGSTDDFVLQVIQLEEARRAFILSNLKLVIWCARKFVKTRSAHLYSLYVDLVHEGFVGLITAVEKYDSSKGTRFGTYATWYIRQTMQVSKTIQMIFLDAPMYLPCGQFHRMRQIQKVLRDVERHGDSAMQYHAALRSKQDQERHHDLTNGPSNDTLLRKYPVNMASSESIARMTGINVRTVELIRDRMRPKVSLDAPTLNDDSVDNTFLEVVYKEPRHSNFESIYDVQSLNRMLNVMIDRCLTDVEAKVIRVRYEISEYNTEIQATDSKWTRMRHRTKQDTIGRTYNSRRDGFPTLVQVADDLGMSLEEVTRIRLTAIRKLRKLGKETCILEDYRHLLA